MSADTVPDPDVTLEACITADFEQGYVETVRPARGPYQARDELDLRPHGTRAAYRRHYRHGEPPCESCRQAEARRWQDYGPARPSRNRSAG